ncbi:MAG: multi-sensor signal transduction histidine kinase, partial [Chitinophagaceae bacterium]|nr:multi-sensor signal transduction histidine kinase [Chitinophagaceae bacterium]
MRRFLVIAVCCLCGIAVGQNTETDSLKKLLNKPIEGTQRVQVLEGLSYAYLSAFPDSALQYAQEGLELAEKINYPKGQALCTNALGNVYFHVGDYPRSLELYFKSLQIEEGLKTHTGIPVTYFNISSVYTEQQDYAHALSYLFKAKQEDERKNDSSGILFDLYSLGSIYLRMEKNDSALVYIEQSHQLAQKLNDLNMMGAILNTFGEAYVALKNNVLAGSYYHNSIPYALSVNDKEVLAANYYGLARICSQNNKPDSAIYYARKALTIANEAPFLKQVMEFSTFLSGMFKDKKQFDSAFRYQAMSTAAKDSIFNVDKIKKIQNLKFQEQQRQHAIESARLEFWNNVKLYVVVGASAVLLIIAFLLWQNNKQKQKAFILLQDQQLRTEEAYKELKATQAQLIQSEKMASLGELTSGIAHEIQNPLNFVNNFSEVNRELIAELKNELKKGNSEEIELLASDIEQNELKIIHHGKRAEAIVKGMLQHSRNRTGSKESTNLNALADEYLRIAYHGMLAKNKSFETTMKTSFDAALSSSPEGLPDAGKINIVPEDIAKVLLNLYNNAFYAVNEKNKQGIEGYEPKVTVTTKKTGIGAEIIVHDNGNGIPQNII